jgi:hypothetical protein
MARLKVLTSVLPGQVASGARTGGIGSDVTPIVLRAVDAAEAQSTIANMQLVLPSN